MEKLNYITRQFSKIQHKRFEHYVITRIWNLLNDLTIKFVTQQYVIRPNGRALTDLYFPQLGIHIEVDETYHLNQLEQDKLRELDIINATNHVIKRVDTNNGVENVNSQIDKIVQFILNEKNKIKNFKPWNIQAEQDPETYIKKGSISIKDDVAFKFSYLAANCFGHKYKGYQKGGTYHPYEKDKLIWFPKLYENSEWKNSISEDEKTIIELSQDTEYIKRHVEKNLNIPNNIRIVFARVRSPLGEVIYKFKGEFELDKLATNTQIGLIWKRISDEVKTYK